MRPRMVCMNPSPHSQKMSTLSACWCGWPSLGFMKLGKGNFNLQTKVLESLDEVPRIP